MRAAGGLRGDRRGHGRGRLPVLRRLSDDAVHRGARAHGPMLPAVGGVCMNAESELEAVGMAWGAAATGTPAATGSVGQGLSLMQESLAEITLARLPLVVLNMARGPGRLLPGDAGRRPRRLPPPRAGADGRRRGGRADAAGLRPRRHAGATRCWSSATTTSPTPRSRSSSTARLRPARRRAGLGARRLDRRLRPGQARSRRSARPSSATASATTCPSTTRHGAAGTAQMLAGESAAGRDRLRATTPRWSWSPSARPAGTCAPRCASCGPRATGRLRAADHAVPVPHRRRSPAAAEGARAVAVYENNQGQMIDDVRLAVLGRGAGDFIGGLSLDGSGFGIAPDLDVGAAAERILARRTSARARRHDRSSTDAAERCRSCRPTDRRSGRAARSTTSRPR